MASVQKPAANPLDTKKEPAMGEKVMLLEDIDLAKVDLVVLKKFVDAASMKFQERKQGELRTLCNGWVAKAAAVGYGVQDIITELKTHLPAAPAKKQRAVRGTAVKKEQPFTRGVTYANPDNKSDTWTAGLRGQKPRWLRARVDNQPFEAQKAIYEELAVKE